jgi:hypothetical protein
MANQKLAASSAADSNNARTAVAGDFVLGAGWGASTLVVTAGSTDKRGEIVITCATGGGLAQATATIVHTYDAWPSAPFPWVKCTNDNSLTAASDFTINQASTTTTSSTWTYQVLPVNTKIYTVRYRYDQ